MQEHTQAASTIETVTRFLEALNRHDIPAAMALMTPDCVFENTYPAPDGERFIGQDAVRRFWERLFQESPQSIFQTEEVFAIGDRCVVRWRYDWSPTGHVRGVDIIRVLQGKIQEKLAYVKG